jgi:predicted RNA-binding Zn-ribbon protein involved in translation (DUF1610 family)
VQDGVTGFGLFRSRREIGFTSMTFMLILSPVMGGNDAPTAARAAAKAKLQPCPDCGHAISKRALACPNCGRKMKFKGAIAAVLIWILIAVTAIVIVIWLVNDFDKTQRQVNRLKATVQQHEEENRRLYPSPTS